ncbi:ATP-binding protein [Sphaerisporangium rufum]|nr:ATP-binding protein [Sphaerisporangium rufum]
MESPFRAREWIKERLGADHPAVEDVTLLVSEVVTNAAVHSDSQNGGRVTVALADCFDRIHVDVVDEGGASVPEVRGDVFAEGGRGLLLVDVISDTWGIYEGEAGRTVWFEVAYRRGGQTDHQRGAGPLRDDDSKGVDMTPSEPAGRSTPRSGAYSTWADVRARGRALDPRPAEEQTHGREMARRRRESFQPENRGAGP